MVEQWNRYGEQWDNDGGTVEMEEQWNRDGGPMEQCNSDYGTEEQLWWNSGKEMVEQWINDGETVEQ